MVADYQLNSYALELSQTLATLKPLELRVLEVAFGFFSTDLTQISKDGKQKQKVNLSELCRVLNTEQPGLTRSQTVALYRATVNKLRSSGFLELYREICEAISYQSETISN